MNLRQLFSVLFTGVLAFAAGYFIRPTLPPETPSTPAVIERIKALGTLDATIVEVAAVRETRVNGLTGSGSLLLIVRGQAIVGVDLTQAKLSKAGGESHHFRLTLPTPQVTIAKVDTAASRVYRIDRDGLWQLSLDDQTSVELINRALADAQSLVTEAGGGEAIVHKTKSLVQAILTQLAAQSGCSLEIEWIP